MEDRLAAVAVAIGHHPVSVPGKALLTSDARGRQIDLAHQFGRGLVEVGDGLDVLVGNDENVGRRGRIDVANYEQTAVIAQFFGGNFTVAYLAEQAVTHGQN